MTLTRTYYNEYDPFAADWLESLIYAGHLPPGDVDRRSLLDVCPADLIGYQHCHFFAGIGGWALSQQWADWPDALPLWTGSCPCQPYSAAGKQQGADDHRDLWPAWCRLLRGTNLLRHQAGLTPIPVVAGEQVEGAIRHGWWDRLQRDLEGEGYACGMGVLGAHSVGSPHLRQRLYWLAESDAQRRASRQLSVPRGAARSAGRDADRGGEVGDGAIAIAGAGGLAHADRQRRQQIAGGAPANEAADGRAGRHGREPDGDYVAAGHGEDGGGVWADPDWLPCRDGKLRPVESGTFPLAHGVPKRVGRLRGYGNAIVPQLGADVLRTYLETLR